MGALKIVICFALLCWTAEGATAATATAGVKAAYWPSGKLQSLLRPSAINTRLFTHVYFGFVMPSKDSFTYDHLSESTTALLSRFTFFLRQTKPPAKSLLSIGGGGNSDGDLFARIASNPSSRKIFVDSTITLARKFGFHGVDLDWEFPKDATEMKYFGYLITHMRKIIDRDANATSKPPLLLTAAVYYLSEFKNNGLPRAYPVEMISQNVDWINVRCFDYHGSWDTSATGAHAALFDPQTNVSSFAGLWSWVHAGVPQNKLVMGIPLYGRSWTLKDPNQHGIGAPAVAIGPGFGDGIMTYNQVEVFNSKPGVKVVFDLKTASAYSYLDTTWIGYDNQNSTAEKVKFAQSLGLRGYFFWALSYDTVDSKLSTIASDTWDNGRH